MVAWLRRELRRIRRQAGFIVPSTLRSRPIRSPLIARPVQNRSSSARPSPPGRRSINRPLSTKQTWATETDAGLTLSELKQEGGVCSSLQKRGEKLKAARKSPDGDLNAKPDFRMFQKLGTPSRLRNVERTTTP